MVFTWCHFLVEDVFDVVGTDGFMNNGLFNRVDDGYSAIVDRPRANRLGSVTIGVPMANP